MWRGGVPFQHEFSEGGWFKQLVDMQCDTPCSLVWSNTTVALMHSDLAFPRLLRWGMGEYPCLLRVHLCDVLIWTSAMLGR